MADAIKVKWRHTWPVAGDAPAIELGLTAEDGTVFRFRLEQEEAAHVAATLERVFGRLLLTKIHSESSNPQQGELQS